MSQNGNINLPNNGIIGISTGGSSTGPLNPPLGGMGNGMIGSPSWPLGGGPIDPYGSYPAHLPSAAWPTYVTIGDCTACEDKNTTISYTYQGPSITRRICKKCHTKALDKMFGVPINSELESVLYEQKEKV